MPTIKFEDYLRKQLKDPKFAAAYLNVALTEDSPKEFLASLKSVIMANGGIAKIASKSGISRQHLYRVIGKNGNPSIHMLMSILKSLKIKLCLDYQSKSKKIA